MNSYYAVVATVLYLIALGMLAILDAATTWRDKRRHKRAMAHYDRVAAETVIVTDMDPIERSEYLRTIREHARPKFGVCPHLLDGGIRVDTHWGQN